MADPRIKEICDSANPPLRRLWISLGPGLLFAESKNHKDFQLAKARYLNQFAAADAVLASAGAVERKRAMDRSLVDPFGLRDLLGVVRLSTITKWKLPSPTWHGAAFRSEYSA